MQKKSTKKLVGVAMLGALAAIVMLFSFPIIPAIPFLKIDFSDVPILIGMFLYGPSGGISVALVRSLLHYVQTGGDAGFPIGDTASFIASVLYTLPIYSIIHKKGTETRYMILAGVLGTLSLTAVLTVLNYTFLLPLYAKILGLDVGSLFDYFVLGIVPFNLIKGAVISLVFIVLFSKLKPWIERNQLKQYKIQ